MMRGRNGSILTLSYLGAERALANYNVMGLAKASLEACVRYLALNLGPEGTRVNAISAGPIKTLAAAGIANFRKMLGHVEALAPLESQRQHRGCRQRRRLSYAWDLAAGITGEVTHVDAGYSILGCRNRLTAVSAASLPLNTRGGAAGKRFQHLLNPEVGNGSAAHGSRFSSSPVSR